MGREDDDGLVGFLVALDQLQGGVELDERQGRAGRRHRLERCAVLGGLLGRRQGLGQVRAAPLQGGEGLVAQLLGRGREPADRQIAGGLRGQVREDLGLHAAQHDALEPRGDRGSGAAPLDAEPAVPRVPEALVVVVAAPDVVADAERRRHRPQLGGAVQEWRRRQEPGAATDRARGLCQRAEPAGALRAAVLENVGLVGDDHATLGGGGQLGREHGRTALLSRGRAGQDIVVHHDHLARLGPPEAATAREGDRGQIGAEASGLADPHALGHGRADHQEGRAGRGRGKCLNRLPTPHVVGQEGRRAAREPLDPGGLERVQRQAALREQRVDLDRAARRLRDVDSDRDRALLDRGHQTGPGIDLEAGALQRGDHVGDLGHRGDLRAPRGGVTGPALAAGRQVLVEAVVEADGGLDDDVSAVQAQADDRGQGGRLGHARGLGVVGRAEQRPAAREGQGLARADGDGGVAGPTGSGLLVAHRGLLLIKTRGARRLFAKSY